MRAREATAFLLGPLVLAGIVFLPAWVYLGTIWIIALLAAWELIALLRQRSHPVQRTSTLIVLAAALPALWLLDLPHAGSLLALPVLLLPLAYLLGRGPIDGAASAITGGVFTVVYFVVAAGAMGLLRTAFPELLGVKVVITHCLIVWAGDSGALYAGTLFGKHKMAPRVSPKKSWEGLAGGTAVTFFAVWFCKTVFFPELSWSVGLAWGALLTVIAPLGDLVESLFKRDAAVKDSSALIPGHGGFLDRTDSLFFAAPFVLALLLVMWTPA